MPIILVFIFCIVWVPLASCIETPKGAASSYQPATFDLFSMFPDQMLSPSTGHTVTVIPIETRNISDTTDWVWLSTSSESNYFNAYILPFLVEPAGVEGRVKSWVLISCSPDTPEGAVGYIKVTGRRDDEEHRVWLKVTALASEPVLQRSSGDMLLGQGHKDPALQPFLGRPLSWNLSAGNNGGAQDTYSLAYQADFPCQVRFLDSGGMEINDISVPGLTRNYLYPSSANFVVDVTPEPGLPKNQPMDITFTLGPGNHTATTSELTLQVVNPGMLFCMNDLDGLKPHAHQVMPGETTSFILHVTNLEGAHADIRLTLNGAHGEWEVNLDTDTLETLPQGETAQVILTVTPPSTASVGDRLNVEISASSSLGAEETVSVSSEVTDVRNVYYWAIDSMDPDYLYMNRLGTGPGSEGDWLMPNLHAFLGESVNYTNARVYLPSATDMDHTNALAGTYTGTQGIYMVSGTFCGFTEYDEVITAANSMELMRFRKTAQDGSLIEGPIERIYEVAKEETGGKSLGGVWSNKNWLADLEGERTVDIVGHSNRYPLFFPPPYKYMAAGDPQTDENPWDPMSGPFFMCFYTDTTREILIPTLLGQFDLLLGLGIYLMPVSLVTGMTPGNHCEDRYLADSFFRSILEEDPDVSYINIADLDNTGHMTGSSWNQEEWDTKGTAPAWDDKSKYSPWMRRDECLDICREADILFGNFLNLLKERGVYDNSIILVLSDHGMENVKDERMGFEVLDLRGILRAEGLVHHEDFHEGGGTQINFIWCDDEEKLDAIEQTLEGYTVDDPLVGPVQPLMVINRQEMIDGVDYGEFGRVRPRELYSEYWITHPYEPDGHLWPDLCIFPLYNYNVVAHGRILAGGINPIGITLGNLPDNLELGFPAAHGGLQTAHIPLIFKAPAGNPNYTPGLEYAGEVEVGDIAPTIYQILGWEEPDCVDGTPLPY